MATPNFNFPTINQSDTANVPRDHNALATAIDTAFQQTEYQTAAVVGAQIRISKPSASNRIFFRLSNAINGGTPITISTDGGSTSLNLTDNDGANVLSIEKGFVEIVKVGNFFILRSKGISSAQLAELAGKIGAPAVATDDFNTQLSKLQDAKDTFGTKLGVPGTTALQEMADSLVVGKRVATVTASRTNANSISISGLSFTPRLAFGTVAQNQNVNFLVCTDSSFVNKIGNATSVDSGSVVTVTAAPGSVTIAGSNNLFSTNQYVVTLVE